MERDEELSVADHLMHFTDPRRIGRGEKINDEELRIEVSSNELLHAKIRGYFIDIDLDRKVLKHDCDDWRKGRQTKRMCKHMVKFFMSLPPGQAKRVLRRIWTDLDGWVFE